MRWIVMLMLLTGSASAAAAQDSTGALPTGFSVGMTLDQYYVAEERFAATALRGMVLRRGGWAEELAIGHTVGDASGTGGFFITDLGVTRQVAARGAQIFTGLGATMLFTGRSGGVTLGGFVDGGVLLRVLGRAALRVGGSRRWYFGGGEVVGVWGVSVGVSLLPPERAVRQAGTRAEGQ